MGMSLACAARSISRSQTSASAALAGEPELNDAMAKIAVAACIARALAILARRLPLVAGALGEASAARTVGGLSRLTLLGLAMIRCSCVRRAGAGAAWRDGVRRFDGEGIDRKIERLEFVRDRTSLIFDQLERVRFVGLDGDAQTPIVQSHLDCQSAEARRIQLDVEFFDGRHSGRIGAIGGRS